MAWLCGVTLQLLPQMADVGLPVRFVRKPATANESVERLARGIASHWENAPKVVVAFDMNDPIIPENVRKEDQRQRSGGATGTPEGFYYKGTVYLMSSKLGTPNDIARVLFHEALGHYGLRGTFGKALRPILRDVAMLRRAEVDAKIKQYGLKMGNTLDRFTAAEEVLAELAQTKPEIGFVQRAIAAIRTWLRQNVPGFNNMRLSDNELIQNYILPARAWVEQGGGPKGGLPVRVEPTFSRGTNDPMTNKDVVGNQGGRSADDTTPGVLFTDENENAIVFERDGFRISVNKPGAASYVVLWAKQEVNGKTYWRKAGTLDTNQKTKKVGGVSGEYLGVSSIEIEKAYRGQGLGLEMYRALISQSAPNIKGIISHTPNRVNKQQVPSIYKKLGAFTDGDNQIIPRIGHSTARAEVSRPGTGFKPRENPGLAARVAGSL